VVFILFEVDYIFNFGGTKSIHWTICLLKRTIRRQVTTVQS